MFIIMVFCSFSGIPIDVGVTIGDLIAVPVYWWAIVGTWRSATNYGEQHNGFNWGIVAQAVIVVGVIKQIIWLVDNLH